MKNYLFGLASIVMSVSGFAADNRYEIQTDSYGSTSGGSTDIVMKKKYDYDPSNKFRGEIESDGSVRMKNYNGDRLRGEIDKDGYGTLRDQDGNTYRVRP